MANGFQSPAIILVVDDSVDILELLELALGKRGYAVLLACCQEEAVAIWEEYGGHIDLLITDVKLGASGSGLDMAERFVALKPSLKVLAISGFVLANRWPRLGHRVELLKKPFGFTEMVSRVEALLRPALEPVKS